MTVKELIEKLSELDQELHVFIPGYEGGYNYAEISEVKNICLNVNPEDYYGPHDDFSMCRQDPSNYKQVKGIVL
jgi:hypothetical protein